MDKRKLKVTFELLHEVSVDFPEQKHLEQKWTDRNMLVGEVIYFFTNLVAMS